MANYDYTTEPQTMLIKLICRARPDTPARVLRAVIALIPRARSSDVPPDAWKSAFNEALNES